MAEAHLCVYTPSCHGGEDAAAQLGIEARLSTGTLDVCVEAHGKLAADVPRTVLTQAPEAFTASYDALID